MKKVFAYALTLVIALSPVADKIIHLMSGNPWD